MPTVSFKTRIKLIYDLLQRVSNTGFLTYIQLLKSFKSDKPGEKPLKLFYTNTVAQSL